MADQVTCCPHCNTAFHVTDAQLATAKGAVRCGSCLQVFKALDHLTVSDTPADTSIAEPSTTTHSTANPSTTDAISTQADPTADFDPLPTDIDFGAEESIDEETDDSFNIDLVSEPVDATDESETEIEANTPPQPSDDDELISDDMDNSLGQLSDEFLDRDSTPQTHGGLFDRNIQRKTTASSEPADDSWAEQLLEDDNEPYIDNPSSIQYDTDDTEDLLDESLLADLDEQEAEPQTGTGDNILAGIGDAPVEMEWHDQTSPWPRRLLWGGLSLLGAITLIAQIGWFEIDRYARQDSYRGIYETLCPSLGCKLPPRYDINQIKSYNLVVRSHPKADNALAIDSILINTASFSQPFPNLTLLFSDINGKPVAHRVFTPREYLGGELAGADTMPSQTPIHIALEVIDPGKQAVNYNLAISPQ
ncbi:MAG: DUF3426 domain-containing protein [Candidatus Pelagadaptatus aseana]|uniref:DUF3426 domain-containing protein n=1 Tax=Candidatus Pelagadaptatus aseana TaxID=3120508 RepID=UPI0039B2CC21